MGQVQPNNQQSLENRYFELRWHMHEFSDSDPDRAIGMAKEAINIAEQLEAPLWIMECRHWLAQYLVFKKRDYGEALPLTIKATVEARKPLYKTWRTRTCLYQDLIATYIGIDAIGYAGEIEEALTAMQAEAPSDSQCARCLQGERTRFELRLKQFNNAQSEAETYLNISHHNHHKAQAYIRLCQLAHLQQEWQSLLEYGEQAQKTAKASGNHDVLIEALMWQAVAYQWLGQHEQAIHYLQQSDVQRGLSGVTLAPEYFTARVSYYEFLNNIKEAIAVRQDHLAQIQGYQAHQEEAEGWLDLCRLQKKQGVIPQETIDQARASLTHLRKAEDLTAQLEALLFL